MYSLLGCCKAADVNFRDWMVYVLSQIHDYDEDYNRDLAELLPDNYSGLKNSKSTPNVLEVFESPLS